MCARFGQFIPWDKLVELYGLEDEPAPNAYTDHYNAAPTLDLAVVRHSAKDGRRHGDLLRWGLVPSWAKDAAIGRKTINSRAESVATASTVRAAFAKGRRCVVPADGFYEWKATGDGRQPYWISRADGKPLNIAGLWEGWKDPQSGEWLRTFTIVTTDANELIGLLHHRMPAILEDADIPAWLGEAETSPEALQALLRPFPSDLLRMWPVSRAVGNVRAEGAMLIEPLSL